MHTLWLKIIFWLATVVIIFLVSRWVSRRGYIRKDKIDADEDIKPCPPDAPIDRTAKNVLRNAVKCGADVVGISRQGQRLYIYYFRKKELYARLTELELIEETVLPPYFTDQLMMQLFLLVKDWEKKASEKSSDEPDPEIHNVKIRLDFDYPYTPEGETIKPKIVE